MPELPEVEHAATRLREAAVGRRIASVRVHHPALRRQLSRADLARTRGARIERIERRGKHQLLHLDNGYTLVAHFRMTGDWHIAPASTPRPAYARAEVMLDDGTRVTLDDPRALSTLSVAPADALPLPRLGPDPLSREFTARSLGTAFARRTGPVKPALLDQSVVAGIGNIYASEALWRARVHPATSASRLESPQLRALTAAIRFVLRAALRHAHRYYGAERERPARFAVYDREGEPCRRCETPIARITQAARSTYFCPHCQRR
jgi:formamidopyrimidine-DNA glycosylase